jgi:predicted TIM-barrel fold metal-dependent hydrolase
MREDKELKDDLRIVDAHHHLWDLEGAIRYPWLTPPYESRHGDHSAFCRTYLPDEYRRDTALHNVIATVHVEAECAREHDLDETRWLTELHARHGMPNVIVAHSWLDTPDAEEVIAAQSRYALVRGIRSKPATSAGRHESIRGQPRTMQDDKWLRGLGLLEKYGLSWDLRVPWWHLEEAAEVARLYPNLPIVLNHTGCLWDRDEAAIAAWRRGMQALAANANVHCKISGLLVTGQPWTFADNAPIIREAIRIFGVDRCMFASNVPPDTLKGSWDYLYTNFRRAVSDLPRADQEKLFSENALRFYRIEVPGHPGLG